VLDAKAVPRRARLTAATITRILWALLSAFVVESLVFGLSVLPGVLFWEWHFRQDLSSAPLRVVFLSMAFIPAYLLFTLALILLSGVATRITGWRTPENAELDISEFSWPLLDWARYVISIQLVRIFAGSLFRATPIWTFYMRLNGARMGRRVFVNSLEVTDHNLLDFGDDVVVGGDAHLSGHTVENGILKTAAVRLGRGVTVGVGSVVGIGVVAGDRCQIGALSLVPKFAELEAGAVYVGIPVRKMEPT
jgi:acetyltransferase-like isoleucine patch superfamily enzyme